jgi:hypothetical protein
VLLFCFLCLLLIVCAIFLSLVAVVKEEKPCLPNPCGPYSQCRVLNEHAVCSCLESYVGSPPSCRPECVVSAECPQNKACIGQKCQDPCTGVCGINAQCNAINHNPICTCNHGYTGDAFVRCIKQREELFL